MCGSIKKLMSDVLPFGGPGGVETGLLIKAMSLMVPPCGFTDMFPAGYPRVQLFGTGAAIFLHFSHVFLTYFK